MRSRMIVAAAMSAEAESVSGDEIWKKFSKAIGRSAPLSAVKTRGEVASAALPQSTPTSPKRAGLTTDPAVIGSLKPSGAGRRRSAQKPRAIDPLADRRMRPARKFPSTAGSSKASSVTKKKNGDEKRSPDRIKQKRRALATPIPFQIWTPRRRRASGSASACPRIAGLRTNARRAPVMKFQHKASDLS